MTNRRSIVTLVVVLAVLVGGGIFLRSQSQSASAPSRDLDPQAITTSSFPTPLSTSDVPVTDWKAELDRIVKTENDLFVTPDPTKVNAIMLNSCTCFLDTQNKLKRLQQRGWHIDGPSFYVDRSGFITGTTSSMTIAVFPKVTKNATIDANGTVVEAAPDTNSPTIPQKYVLDKGSDGVWRIAERSPFSEQVPVQ